MNIIAYDKTVCNLLHKIIVNVITQFNGDIM